MLKLLFKSIFVIVFLTSCESKHNKVWSADSIIGYYEGRNNENGELTSLSINKGLLVVAKNIPIRTGSGIQERSSKFKSIDFTSQGTITDLTPSGGVAVSVNGIFLYLFEKRNRIYIDHTYDVVRDIGVTYKRHKHKNR